MKFWNVLFIIVFEKIYFNVFVVIMYIGEKDFIFYLGVGFFYIKEKDLVEFFCGKIGVVQLFFLDSYYVVDIYMQKISWECSLVDLYLIYEYGIFQEQ